MVEYEISDDTLAIIPVSDKTTKVIEKDNTFIVNLSSMKIINNSCEYFGSSFDGRNKGTKKLIGVSYKAPIIVEESKNIIFFPTTSPRLMECTWISLKNLLSYKKSDMTSEVTFNNGISISLDISYGQLDNQILRATRLESVLRNRKCIS